MLDDDFLLLVNAWWEPLDFTVPPTRPGQTWCREIDTFDPTGGRVAADSPASPIRSPSGPAPSSSSEPRQHPDGAARHARGQTRAASPCLRTVQITTAATTMIRTAPTG